MGKKISSESVEVEDKIALERHEFFMKAMKTLFTLGVMVVLIFTTMVIYSSFVKNEFPTASDVVELLQAMLGAIIKVS